MLPVRIKVNVMLESQMMSGTTLIHESVAEIHENKLVDRIVGDIMWGCEFFQFHGMPSGMKNKQCVSLQSAPGAPKGDIDLLFCAPNIPEQSVAYQIKRIKLGINQLRNGTPGKLQEFKKLSQQANLLAQMGFWQVYAYAIVVVDARAQNGEEEKSGKLVFTALSSELRSRLETALSSAIQFFDAPVGFGDAVDTDDGLRSVHSRQPQSPYPSVPKAHGTKQSAHRLDRGYFLQNINLRVALLPSPMCSE